MNCTQDSLPDRVTTLLVSKMFQSLGAEKRKEMLILVRQDASKGSKLRGYGDKDE